MNLQINSRSAGLQPAVSPNSIRQPVRTLLFVYLVCFVGSLCLHAAPPPPVFPNPAHGLTNVPVDAHLYWSLGEQELIVNGDFEAGNFTGWIKQNQNGDTYMNNGAYQPTTGVAPFPPYAGNWCTITEQTGGFGGIFQTLYQEVLIPTNAQSAVLRWVDRMWNFAGAFFNPPGPQRVFVEVRTTDGAPLELLYTTEPGDNPFSNWTKRSADLRHYAGQRIRVAFVCQVSRAPLHLLLDNISLVANAASATRYDVYFGANSTLVASNFVGTVSNATWTPPQLQPNTTYYWRVNTRQGTDTTLGPVWQFRTSPLSFVDHFAWANIPSPQNVGQSFAVALSARDAGNNLVTNFGGASSVEPLTLSAFRVAESSWHILGDQPHAAFVNHDRATVGYSFTPNTDIMVTAIRRYAGEKVSIWNERGILLASARGIGPAATWSETPLPQALGLAAGRTYVIGVYSAVPTTNYARFDGLSTFSHGTIDQAFEGNGDAMPTSPHPARWWYVDLVHSPAVGAPLNITPDTILSFTNAVWRGPVTFHETAARAYLRAGWRDQSHESVGLSTIFAVTEAPLRITSIEYDGATATISFPSASGKSYVLERSPDASGAGTWRPVNSPRAGTGDTMQITDTTAGAGPTRFYRLSAE